MARRTTSPGIALGDRGLACYFGFGLGAGGGVGGFGHGFGGRIL